MPKGSLLPPDPTPTFNDYLNGTDMSGPTSVKYKIEDLRALFATKRVTPITSSATLTPNTATDDVIPIAALAANLTILAPTGSPYNTQVITLRIRDDGTARSITWNAIYRGIGVTLPTATTAGKLMYITMMYMSDDGKWDVLSIGRQG